MSIVHVDIFNVFVVIILRLYFRGVPECAWRALRVQAKVDVSRFVRWPKYIRLQRQKKILFQRLKIPPSINVFRNPLDRAEGPLAFHPPFSFFSMLTRTHSHALAHHSAARIRSAVLSLADLALCWHRVYV